MHSAYPHLAAEDACALCFPIAPPSGGGMGAAQAAAGEQEEGSDGSKLSMRHAAHRRTLAPLVAGCQCYTCQNHTRRARLFRALAVPFALSFTHHLMYHHHHPPIMNTIIENHTERTSTTSWTPTRCSRTFSWTPTTRTTCCSSSAPCAKPSERRARWILFLRHFPGLLRPHSLRLGIDPKHHDGFSS